MSSISILSADEIFEQWLRHCAVSDRRPISEEDADAYRYIWSTWKRFLDGERVKACAPSVHWADVTAPFVLNFLHSGIGSRKTGADVSAITKRRYWRVLDRIYAFAVEKGILLNNPASSLSEQEKPPKENPLGAILSPRVWNRCIQMLDEPIGPEVAQHEIAVRNRALLRVLFELGLTPAELRGLLVQAFVDKVGQQDASIKVDGESYTRVRELLISERTRVGIVEWLRVKATSPAHAASEILFSGKTGKVLTDEQLLNLVRAFLLKACASVDEAPPLRLGPQIVRNTLLVRLLHEGVHQDEVVVRAGLKNAKGLLHLRQHLPDGPRLKLAGATRHKDNEAVEPELRPLSCA
ncbi:tyrosine-type recombinase/integrase (plasmid) [Acidovorax sp. DW039]|uniref:tyrosine-type recombinase/integrase n=1 Tax=Acidovorax sp. DW039 TaxID=3095606 RepID=UPI003092A4F0|nr:tyrosine-type recombinase/integrase [Acidovorax sp. DW039]